MSRRGRFIVFEGVDGAGTSTQCQRLCDRLRERGQAILQTREPGGTAIGERIRELLLDPSHSEFDDLTELLLYAAARRQHTVEKIAPALQAGMQVISDRYADSTVAYQGAGRRLSPDIVAQVNGLATGGLTADLTFVIDVDVATAADRRQTRAAAADRLEQAGQGLQASVRDAFLELAAREPDRVAVIDGSRSVDEVESAVVSTLIDRFPDFPLR